ncbi:hypothetical protein RBB50_007457 [Rhinocladiella similis]
MVKKKGTDWRPESLTRTCLFINAAVLAAIILALALLYHYSRHNDGMVTASSNLHYLWTFGPTAILTLTTAFWQRVEFHSKQLAPWTWMSKEATSAHKSVLLDYITPIVLNVLWQSFKNKD